MIVVFSAFIHLMLPHFHDKMTFGEKMNNWFNYTFMVLYIVAPLVTIWLLYSHFDSLDSDSFNKRFNTLYESLDTTKKWPLICFRVSFYMRRFLLIAAILFAKHVCFQIILLFVQVFLQIAVIGFLDPYKEK